MPIMVEMMQSTSVESAIDGRSVTVRIPGTTIIKIRVYFDGQRIS